MCFRIRSYNGKYVIDNDNDDVSLIRLQYGGHKNHFPYGLAKKA
jgi:hypothetical protein